ncbi:hypothetical protein PVAP13_2KG099000 [Panicum virgatum]|uniref:Uncharacterized protein n=1 Tax=Panicum virgatum TaxID=38727 RepID=A0A8T0VZL2_PANVG|nr:hypothetical protein PVAP13_2KG099000 [Panicum virgatum]
MEILALSIVSNVGLDQIRGLKSGNRFLPTRLHSRVAAPRIALLSPLPHAMAIRVSYCCPLYCPHPLATSHRICSAHPQASDLRYRIILTPASRRCTFWWLDDNKSDVIFG